ncbi:hypothetical protein [Bradyrhizobium commune]|uniref:DUF3551 domain-containing protein n=1 Tax=Bradyrhizobium commune TaxID=83627 RepID=A0A7S9CZV0_9BRAD|nr:hypothetical protein [Bradyrhizobium commune]QPF88598.1 hypothetical protein IC761_18835 [Bradyrhizobium commune]
MHRLAFVAVALLGSGMASAEEPAKKADEKPNNCFYTVGGQSITLSIGARICRRQPAPYNDKYSLLRCNPPLDEIDSDVKRGDARCERYEGE